MGKQLKNDKMIKQLAKYVHTKFSRDKNSIISE